MNTGFASLLLVDHTMLHTKPDKKCWLNFLFQQPLQPQFSIQQLGIASCKEHSCQLSYLSLVTSEEKLLEVVNNGQHKIKNANTEPSTQMN